MSQAENPNALAGRLVKALSRLRERHSDMTVLQAMSLFFIAANPGITQRRLYQSLGTSDSVASRTIAVLTDIGTAHTAALNLVTMKLNPEDRRERLLYLSARGERLVDDIAADLRGR